MIKYPFTKIPTKKIDFPKEYNIVIFKIIVFKLVL